MFDVSFLDHMKMAGIGLGLTLIASIMWAIVMPYSGLFSSLAVIALAYGIGELGSRSVNKKQGRGLQIISGGCVALGYMVFTDFYISIFGFLMLAIAISIATRPFRQI